MLIISIFLATGCSNNIDPVLPDQIEPGDLHGQTEFTAPHLWGNYEIYIDVENEIVNAIPKRHSAFTANVVSMLNTDPASLSFAINKIKFQPGYVDIDLDISITHPFSNLTQFNGYDVRGVFMGNGATLSPFNPDWKSAAQDTDQFMLPSPVSGNGGPDGYTRWFNYTEFNSNQMPIVEYTPGIYATPGFAGTATVNPYKYFADGLGSTDNAFTWLVDNAGTNGVFSAGSTNIRNYYLRFPTSLGITFGYAILANWKGAGPAMHPANTRETVAIEVEITPDVYYIDESDNGGSIILDISIYDWFSELTGGVMEDYRIFITSTVLDSFKKFSDQAPTGSGTNYFTYHLEIPTDNVTSTEGHEFWVIVDYSGENYTNTFGVPNLAGNDLLAAGFRFDLYVHDASYKNDPICDLSIDPTTPAVINRWDTEGPYDVIFDATGSYDPDGTALAYSWDFDCDGIFDEVEDDFYSGTPDNPTHTYTGTADGNVTLKLTDENEGASECSVPVDIDIHPTKNIPLRDGVSAKDIAVDPGNGDLLILYSDKKIYKHRESDYYDPYYAIEFLELDVSVPTMNFIDVSEEGYIILANNNTVANYDPDGVALGGYSISKTIRDIWTQPNSGGTYKNEHHALWGELLSLYHVVYVGRSRPTDYDQTDLFFHLITTSSQTGYDGIYDQYVRGCESIDDANFWVLEGSPDYYCARWDYPSIIYDDCYFGTGSSTDDDTGFKDPKDLTHAAGDVLVALDRLSSGQGRLKGWSISGDVATSEGGTGDASSISGAPLRVDGSDYINGEGDNYFFVLHGTTGNYMLSIFFPEDVPW